MSRRRLYVFSPLPPQANGLADYLAAYLPWLAADYELRLVTEAALRGPAQDALPGHRVIDDSAFLADAPTPEDQVFYNLGNNADCAYMLDHTARHPGALLLHDPALLHLHQVADRRNWSERLMGHRLRQEGQALPDAFISREGRLNWTPGLLYQECRLLASVAAPMPGVLVHSRYAATRLDAALAGDGRLRARVQLPHFVLPPPPPAEVGREAAVLAEHGVADGNVLLLVPGFLSGNKMLYELLMAHHALAPELPRLKLLFAGQARPEEYDLAARIAALWPGGGGPRITGYLAADALDVLLARADISAILRHPTYGESSGLLPRAAVSGAHVITMDGGAYAELDLPGIHRIAAGPRAAADLTELLRRLHAEADADARSARRAAATQRARSLAPAALYPRLRNWLDASHALARRAHAKAAA